MNNKSFLTDARLRGEYRKFLDGQSAYRRNAPGVDYNAAGQQQNKTEGALYHRATAKPRLNMGRQMQDATRNRPNEQAGLATPAEPSMAPTTLPMKK